MTEIKLTKRYPNSRTEDITDAYMRGWNDALDAVQNGKFHIAEQTEPRDLAQDLATGKESILSLAIKGKMERKQKRQTEPSADTPQTDCGWK